jgi:hypothetical protein
MRIRLGSISMVATAAALMLAGCTAAPVPPARVPDGVSVEISQNRPDYAVRVLEIGVTNGGADDLNLVSASFASPHFVGTADWEEALAIHAGSTTNLRVQLGKPVCSGRTHGTERVTLVWKTDATGSDTTDGAASAHSAPGRTASATVIPSDTTDTINRITGKDCLVEAVDSVITIHEPDALRIDGVGAASVAWIDLALTPTGAGGSVTVDHIAATVLLASASGLDWPVRLTLDASANQQTVSLGLRPTRCDPHAVAEDKRGTIFPFVVTTSAGRAGSYDFAVGDALRGQIYDWIAAHCNY